MQRIDYRHLAPGAVSAMREVQRYVHHCEREKKLLDMHSKDARVLGKSGQRLYAVAVWREASFFSDRERAALAWTEAVIGEQ